MSMNFLKAGATMKKQYFRCASWLLALFLSPLCFGQAISIRVINTNDGRPLPREKVTFILLYEKNDKKPAQYDAQISLKTDGSGEAKLVLPTPPPSYVAARVGLPSEYWHCFCMADLSVQDLLQSGKLVQPVAGSKFSGTGATAGPGEIVFLARPFTFLERLLYPLLKG